MYVCTHTNITTHPYSSMVNLYRSCSLFRRNQRWRFWSGKNTLLILSPEWKRLEMYWVCFIVGLVFCLFMWEVGLFYFIKKKRNKQSCCLFGLVKIYVLIFIILNVFLLEKCLRFCAPNVIHIIAFTNSRKMFPYQYCTIAVILIIR